ncbi:MAG: hypothetical protein AAGA30_04860 [Planctomycetota bacterium]
MPNDFNDSITHFITWTTYGSWLPGDTRGWMKWEQGEQQLQPLLEEWCKGRMKEREVLLSLEQRDAVENVIREHSEHCGW